MSLRFLDIKNIQTNTKYLKKAQISLCPTKSFGEGSDTPERLMCDHKSSQQLHYTLSLEISIPSQELWENASVTTFGPGLKTGEIHSVLQEVTR